MSAPGWPRRSPRVPFDLRVVVLITCPLLLLPMLVLLPVLDAFRLRETRGWPIQTEELLALRARALADGLRHPVRVARTSALPLLELRLPRASHAALIHDLPVSGLTPRKAALAWGDGALEVELRLRGDNAFHWFFPKRSWRLKTKKAEPTAFGRDLHLINPKDRQVIGQLVSAWIARELDLLASPAQPALVTLNGRYQGVYVVQPDIDESLLRRLRRLPGDIYVGDPSRRVDRVEPYRTYLTEPSSWRRVARSGRAPPEGAEPPLDRLIRVLNAGTYWEQRRRPLDEAYYAKFLALVALLGTCHYDSIHNLVLYLDPLHGRFQQFEWDSEGGPFNDREPDAVGPDIASNLIFRELLADPEFRERKDRALYRLVTDAAFLKRLDDLIVDLRDTLLPWIQQDRLDRHSFNFRGPADPRAGFGQWRRFVRDRAAYLKRRLEAGSIHYATEGSDLLLVVDGVPSWTDLTISYPRRRSLPRGVRVRLPGRSAATVFDATPLAGQSLRVPALLLAPGRAPAGSVGEGRLELAPSPQVYRLEGVAQPDVAVEVRHPRTGAWVEVQPLAGPLPRRSPWRRSRPPRPPPDPPSRFRSPPSPDDLVTRSRITIRGSPRAPVVVDGATVALLGRGASGSRFRHVVFRNGVAARKQGVDLLGGVNVHEARDVLFEDCVFVRSEDGPTTEDMLRVARGQVTLRRCRFVNAYSDALDLDFADARIEDCVFERPGNDAIDLMGTHAIISGCTIRGAGDKGISIGEGSHPVVVDSTLTDCAIAVEIKDGSDPLIAACALSGARAINAYAKNWRYADGGHGRIVSSVVKGRVTLDKDSDLQLIACRLQGPKPSGAAAVVESDTARLPDRRVERELGLEPAPRLGPRTPPRRPRPLRPVWDHRFEERLTTSLRGWTLFPPRRRGPSRWFVGRNGLTLRRRTGKALTLTRRPSRPTPTTARALFAIEARAASPLDLTIHIRGRSERAEAVRLGTRFIRHLIPLPPGPLRAIEVRIPPGTTRVNVRRVTLLDAGEGS